MQPGTKVRHKKTNEVGVVVSNSGSKVFVRFESSTTPVPVKKNLLTALPK